MRPRLHALNLGQRIVLIVAFGGLLGTVGKHAVYGLAAGNGSFAYAPMPRRVYTYGTPLGWSSLAAAVFWIALIVIWALGSVWLLRGDGRRVKE
jgi:hypothetical protein